MNSKTTSIIVDNITTTQELYNGSILCYTDIPKKSILKELSEMLKTLQGISYTSNYTYCVLSDVKFYIKLVIIDEDLTSISMHLHEYTTQSFTEILSVWNRLRNAIISNMSIT